MRSIAVVSSMEVSPAMVADFVRSARGNWFEGNAVEHGTIERGEAAVYISADTGLEKGGYEHRDLNILRQMLNAEPQVCVELDVGHGTGSLSLAWEIASRMVMVWGGVIDDCQGNFWPLGSPVPAQR